MRAKMKERMFPKKRGKVICFGIFSVLVILQPALANRYQISFLAGINHVFNYGAEEDYVLGENDFPVTPSHTPANLGASFAVFLNDNVSVELDGRYTFSSTVTLADPSDGDTVAIDTSRHYSLTLNFLYRFLRGNVRPYLVLGGGIDKLMAEDKTYVTEYGFEVDFLAPEKTLDPVANLGGGAYFFLKSNLGIRLDLRYVMIFSDPDSVGSLNGVLGLFFHF